MYYLMGPGFAAINPKTNAFYNLLGPFYRPIYHFFSIFDQFTKFFKIFIHNFTRNFQIFIDQFTLAAAKPWLDRFNYFLNFEGFGLPPPLSHHPPLPAPSRPLPVPLSSSSPCSLHVFHCFITPTLNRLLGPASEHQTG